MRGEPSPRIRAPIASRHPPRSTTSGSQAAPWITVVPRASTAAIITLAVPSTDEPAAPPRYISEPTRPSAGASATTSPWHTSSVAPRARMPFRCRSMGRTPMTQPPGWLTVARRVRARSGPSTATEPRMRRTFSQLACSAGTGAARTYTAPSLRRSTSEPRSRSTSSMVSTSRTRGALGTTRGSSVSSEAASTGSTAFFEPATRTLPSSDRPPSMTSLSIPAPYIRNAGPEIQPRPAVFWRVLSPAACAPAACRRGRAGAGGRPPGRPPRACSR